MMDFHHRGRCLAKNINGESCNCKEYIDFDGNCTCDHFVLLHEDTFPNKFTFDVNAYDIDPSYSVSDDSLDEDFVVRHMPMYTAVKPTETINFNVFASATYLCDISQINRPVKIKWYGFNLARTAVFGVVYYCEKLKFTTELRTGEYYDIIKFSLINGGAITLIKRVDNYNFDLLAFNEWTSQFLLLSNNGNFEILVLDVSIDAADCQAQAIYVGLDVDETDKLLYHDGAGYQFMFMDKVTLIVILFGGNILRRTEIVKVKFDDTESIYEFEPIGIWHFPEIGPQDVRVLNSFTLMKFVNDDEKGVNLATYNIDTGNVENIRCSINGNYDVIDDGVECVNFAGVYDAYGYYLYTGFLKLDVALKMWKSIKFDLNNFKEYLDNGEIKFKPDIRNKHCGLIRNPADGSLCALFTKCSHYRANRKPNAKDKVNGKFAKKLNIVFLQPSN